MTITEEHETARLSPHRYPGVVVAIADRSLREDVVSAVGRRAVLEVVGTANDAGTMLALAAQPGVAAVACDLTVASAAVWAHPTVTQTGSCWLALVTADDLSGALEALCAGFDGALEVEAGPEAVAEALELLLHHDTVLSPTIARTLIAGLRAERERVTAMRPVRSTLTDREWEILEVLRTQPDDTVRDIAGSLVISEQTVASHVKSIYRKLDVHSRGAALAAAERLRRERAADV